MQLMYTFNVRAKVKPTILVLESCGH